jgi:gas vesicle protein
MSTNQTDSLVSDSRVLLALLGGTVLGAVIMALVTPRTGRQVRATLRNTARRLRGGEDLDDDPVEAHFI